MDTEKVAKRRSSPGGRPKVAPDVKEAFAARTVEAAARLFALMKSDDEQIALEACLAVRERSLGKVAQSMEQNGQVTLEQLLIEAARSRRRSTAFPGGDVHG